MKRKTSVIKFKKKTIRVDVKTANKIKKLRKKNKDKTEERIRNLIDKHKK